eukprot:403361622
MIQSSLLNNKHKYYQVQINKCQKTEKIQRINQPLLELVIVDEADSLIFSNQEKFRDFVAKFKCVCFTASPDDQELTGIDVRVLAVMQFKQYHKILDKAEQKIRLDFDKHLPSMTVIKKAKKAKEYAAFGPVIVYCNADLHEEINKQDLEIVVADQDVDHAILKILGQQVNEKFRVVVALDNCQVVRQQQGSNAGLPQSGKILRQVFKSFIRRPAIDRYEGTCCIQDERFQVCVNNDKEACAYEDYHGQGDSGTRQEANYCYHRIRSLFIINGQEESQHVIVYFSQRWNKVDSNKFRGRQEDVLTTKTIRLSNDGYKEEDLVS